MFKNIILTGFMGVGKTSVGTRLARDVNYEFVDTDSLIEADQNMTITRIFSELGEPYFRDVESKIIGQVLQKESQVVSTGGGAVIREANRQAFKQNGFVICLSARPQVIYDRIKHETHRPLLQTPDPLTRIKDLLSSREKFYAEADIIVDTSDRTVDEVLSHIKERIKYAYC